MRYGVPYTGSKNGIAKWVLSNLPRAKNFVDVFARGCAITHAALLSGKYENFIANDLSPAPQLFLDAIHGKYRNEKRWISREDFFRLKDTDAYVKYCFSFGNNGTSYAYGKSEKQKEALHYAIVFDDWVRFDKLLPDFSDVCRQTVQGMTDITERRHKICYLVKIQMAHLQRLQRLQNLERVENLQALQNLQNLTISKSDYRRILIPQDAVIYCDPPYIGTDCRYGYSIDGMNSKYGRNVDYEEFYQWCERQENLVVVSEYTMPKDRFVRVAMKEKRQTLSATANSKIKEEGLYVPRAQEAMYWRMMNDEPMNEFYERRATV